MENNITPVEWYNQKIRELFNDFASEKISINVFCSERITALNIARETEEERKQYFFQEGKNSITSIS